MNEQEHNKPGYWQQRYEAGTTGWDAGSVTTPLREYFEGLTNRSTRILIPGAGNAWEAEWLHRQGFTQVYVLDIAPAPLQHLAERNPDFPKDHLILGDFFTHSGTYDLVIEQTFFCAIDPSQRTAYARKMSEIIRPGGLLAGVMFEFPEPGGPPFGGSRDEYRPYFEPYFHFRKFEPCRNSIPPRQGREIFVILERKDG